MAGTSEGGKAARDKNLARNPNHYRDMGRKGGKAQVAKGFAMDRDRASEAGRKGGLKSRITKKGEAWGRTSNSGSNRADSQTSTSEASASVTSAPVSESQSSDASPQQPSASGRPRSNWNRIPFTVFRKRG